MNGKELTFLDILSIASFVIALQNLDMNITQEDMAKNTDRLDKGLRINVEDIHRHLEMQDKKLDEIFCSIDALIARTEEILNGNTRDIQ